MARTVKEWIGKTDDSTPPASVKLRIIERQDNRCAITGIEFRPGDKIEFDHKVDIWLKGENRESNLRAVLAAPHAKKTAAQASIRSKVMAMRQKHFGLRSKKEKPPLKRKVDGTVVDRRTGKAV